MLSFHFFQQRLSGLFCTLHNLQYFQWPGFEQMNLEHQVKVGQLIQLLDLENAVVPRMQNHLSQQVAVVVIGHLQSGKCWFGLVVMRVLQMLSSQWCSQALPLQICS